MSFIDISSILKFPSKSVVTPFWVPFTKTVAPNKGMFWSCSTTVPDNEKFWALATKQKQNTATKILMCFIQYNFGTR